MPLFHNLPPECSLLIVECIGLDGCAVLCQACCAAHQELYTTLRHRLKRLVQTAPVTKELVWHARAQLPRNRCLSSNQGLLCLSAKLSTPMAGLRTAVHHCQELNLVCSGRGRIGCSMGVMAWLEGDEVVFGGHGVVPYHPFDSARIGLVEQLTGCSYLSDTCSVLDQTDTTRFLNPWLLCSSRDVWLYSQFREPHLHLPYQISDTLRDVVMPPATALVRIGWPSYILGKPAVRSMALGGHSNAHFALILTKSGVLYSAVQLVQYTTKSAHEEAWLYNGSWGNHGCCVAAGMDPELTDQMLAGTHPSCSGSLKIQLYPVSTPWVEKVTHIAAGAQHAVIAGMRTNGSSAVYCCGIGQFFGDQIVALSPVPSCYHESQLPILSLTCGSFTASLISVNGEAWQWGCNVRTPVVTPYLIRTRTEWVLQRSLLMPVLTHHGVLKAWSEGGASWFLKSDGSIEILRSPRADTASYAITMSRADGFGLVTCTDLQPDSNCQTQFLQASALCTQVSAVAKILIAVDGRRPAPFGGVFHTSPLADTDNTLIRTFESTFSITDIQIYPVYRYSNPVNASCGNADHDEKFGLMVELNEENTCVACGQLACGCSREVVWDLWFRDGPDVPMVYRHRCTNCDDVCLWDQFAHQHTASATACRKTIAKNCVISEKVYDGDCQACQIPTCEEHLARCIHCQQPVQFCPICYEEEEHEFEINMQEDRAMCHTCLK